MKYLDFEKEIEPLEESLEVMRADPTGSAGGAISDVTKREAEVEKKLKAIYRNLDSWQTCQVARHPDRPHSLDHIRRVFTDFHELHGDRMYADDMAVVGGLARFQGEPVAVIGHEKGRDTNDKIARNWGMPHPEGYRKALRIMRLAEAFNLPLVTLIDTPGAFCGIGAEERGMSQAIGANLFAMSVLRTRIVSVVIGEGGSGGALAIGVCDELLMLENSVYSVITPEGCTSILWKDGDGDFSVAANAMRMRARDLEKLGLVDVVVPEPIGGAHRDYDGSAAKVSMALRESLLRLEKLDIEACLRRRAQRLRSYGFYKDKKHG